MSLALLALAGNAFAQASVSASDITCQNGSEVELPIEITNDASLSVVGISFTLTLPEGVNVVLDDGEPLYELNSERLNPRRFTVYTKQYDDGSWGFRISTNSTEAVLNGTEGEMMTITLAVAEDMAARDYDILLTENKLSIREADNSVRTMALPDATSTLTVENSDGRIHFDETSTTLPDYAPGDKELVTVARTIKKDQWSTLVLPFNLTRTVANNVFGSDVQFAKFDGFDVDYGDDEENVIPLGIVIYFESYTIPARGNLAGGTPVLIKVSKDITSIAPEGEVTLTKTVTDVEKEADGDIGEYVSGKFTASLVKTVVPKDGLFITDEQFWYSVGNTNIKGFRGWFELDAVLGEETDFGANIRFVVNDEANGIHDIGQEGVKAKEGYYTLDGRKLSSKPTQRGVYIENGKKVVVK
ncbi:MAG: hypothetical protein IKP43_08500 [Bacteroidaceae bacterium]|nr:hypothetical protein [Bacteroidaceae bacterium]